MDAINPDVSWEKLDTLPKIVKRGPATKWTEEQDAKLKEWVAEGYSFSQIAAAMHVSRNAAIGRAHRLGLSGKPPQPRQAETREQKDRRNERARNRRSKTHTATLHRLFAKIEPHSQPVETQIVPLNIPFLELSDVTCKYPYGESNFTYCGHPTAAGQTYCPKHYRICYVPVRRVKLSERGLFMHVKTARKFFRIGGVAIHDPVVEKEGNPVDRLPNQVA